MTMTLEAVDVIPHRKRGLRMKPLEVRFDLPAGEGGRRRTLGITLKRPGSGRWRQTRWVLTISEHFHKDEPEKRSVSVSLRAVPVAVAVAKGSVSPDLLAETLEKYPAWVLGVTARRCGWVKVPLTIGDEWGSQAEEQVRESDADVVAHIVRALREAY